MTRPPLTRTVCSVLCSASQSTLEPPGTPCFSPRGKVLPFCIELIQAQQRAALVMSEPYLISAALSPVSTPSG